MGLLANHGAELLYRSYYAPYTARVITLLLVYSPCVVGGSVGCMAACSDIDSQRPPGGDGAAISGVHRHVGLLQERPGGIGAANGDIERLPRRCHNRQ